MPPIRCLIPLYTDSDTLLVRILNKFGNHQRESFMWSIHSNGSDLSNIRSSIILDPLDRRQDTGTAVLISVKHRMAY